MSLPDDDAAQRVLHRCWRANAPPSCHPWNPTANGAQSRHNHVEIILGQVVLAYCGERSICYSDKK